MTLAAGTRLGPYELESLVGAGGMGEVYKARDTRLDRVVAIKILAPILAAHPDLRDRFEREARAISNLAHPNICTLFDLGSENGIDFIVMEFLEGETLAARLERGALPFDQALSIAIDIVSALEAAHRRGIVHRDLKPGNIVLVRRPGLSGTPSAKLLDFGLAKLSVEGAGPSGSLMTAAATLTQQGTILGTFQYMAPEQLEGGDADERTDIFAFGAMFYEMLTGRRAFQGKSQASLIGAILKDQPPAVSSIQTLTPAAIDRIVARCLAKDRDERWQTASDLAAELRWTQHGGAETRGAPRPRMSRREIAAWTTAAATIAAAAIGWRMLVRPPAAEASVLRFAFEETAEAPFSAAPVAPFPVISPDGQHIIYVAARQGSTELAVRNLDSATVQLVPGTEGGALPFWSPDSRYVGFYANGKLQRYDFRSANIQAIAAPPTFEGATWNRDGTILYGGTVGPLYRVPAEGGTPVAATKLDTSRGEVSHRWPVFMPDGRHYVFVVAPNNHVRFASLNDNAARDLFPVDAKAIFSPPGYLLYGTASQLLARRFDPARGEVLGEGITIAESVRMSMQNARATYSVSDNGILVYRLGAQGAESHVEWYDRSGHALAEALPFGDFRSVALSRDGTRIAFHKHESINGGGVWVKDLTRGTVSRVTLNNSMHAYDETWHPDGRRIAFVESSPSVPTAGTANGAGGSSTIRMTAASGTGDVEPLVASNTSKTAPEWSADGKLLIFQQFEPDTHADIYVMPMDTRQPVPYIHGSANEIGPTFSPDGRWVAYASDESGRFEIYVQPYPATGDKIVVSTTGGVQPRWRGDGRELFFLSPSFGVMAVDVAVHGTTFEPAVPHALFVTHVALLTAGQYRQYEVAADGQSFLVNETPASGRPHEPLSVVVNWTSLLRR